MHGKTLIGYLVTRSTRWITYGVVCVTTACCALVGPAAAPEAKPSEYSVKAAYLFNFGKFVRQAAPPGDQPSTFDICILGHDPFGRTIDNLAANETIDGRAVRVLRINSASDGLRCAVVFISTDEGDRVHADLSALSGSDVLTVGDLPDFLDRGGMIQFVLQGDHVRFSVNLDAVNRAHLALSSELLRVAAAVRGKPEESR